MHRVEATRQVEGSGAKATSWPEELESSVEREVRAFRDAIVGKWAAAYARRRAPDGSVDAAAATADLRRWCRTYFAPAEPDLADAPAADDVQADVAVRLA